MSKWINKELFNKFADEKRNEADKPTERSTRRSELAWKNPEKGTPDKPKIYEGRFLPDPKGIFYKKYHYHMFKTGDQWTFFLCPKTFGMEEFCPWCFVTSHLYMGTKADKKMAYNYKRKDKFAANWYVVNDPRDSETQSDEDKVSGKVRAYEFPGKVEQKLKAQITDKRNGLGPSIFDPGKDGFNFILKVASTKKDADGKEFPDYSLSEFGRKNYPLGSEEEIEKIMSTTIDLEDYIKSMERDEEDVVAALKQHMVWDIVEPEWKRAKGIEEPTKVEEDDIPDFKFGKDNSSEENTKNTTEEKAEEDEPPFDVDEGDEDMSDSDLLKELENL